jgi:O-antigen ligase
VEERRTLLVLFFFATIMKAADSTWIKFFSDDTQKGWGTVLFWRDGFLLCMGLIGAMLMAHYYGKTYRWLRNVMICSVPLMMYGLIVSFRRTFILALLVSAVAMFVSVGKGRRKKQVWLFFSLIFLILLVVLVTDPVGMIARLVGAIFQPQEEGSSYIRLMEYPNILQNIYHNPIFGVPIGTQWFQYYRMPEFANYTTLGCHNTYLYWPLRTGIIGTFAFVWLLARTWKAIIVNIAIQKTEEDFLMNQFLLHCMIVYNFASFFGLMYADAMSIMTSFILVILQLHMLHSGGIVSYRNVNLWQTWQRKEIVFRRSDKLIRPLQTAP